MDPAAFALPVTLGLFWPGTTSIAGYRVPVPRPSLAEHDIEETTEDTFSSNYEYALINKDRKTTTVTVDSPITGVVEL
ncbi:hypothetical protein HOY82DRAFT_619578 [Tuber indicum]|nr:hypothetical protein HOY82DRAFT_619578 [Tuber indicum]